MDDSPGRRGADGRPPFVSVVVPCYNEERYIGQVLSRLAGQYEHGRFEIIVVDGMSSDKTREVVTRFSAENPEARVRLVDNRARNIPAALNLGIGAARGDVIVRMDAHSVPSANYVRRCVELLGSGDAAVVGMPWLISPGAETLEARAIALAVSHPFGIGDAKYRLAGQPSQFVDTVPFGAFHKSLWQRLGGFNEKLLANEDYDFYYRVRRGGGRVLLETSGHCTYYARPTLRDLAAQYFRYGGWKAQMLKLHPRSVKWRQLVAPAFVASLVLLALLGVWWTLALWALLAVVAAYATCALYFSIRLARKVGEMRLTTRIALAFFVMHTAWGGSFLLSLPRPRRS